MRELCIVVHSVVGCKVNGEGEGWNYSVHGRGKYLIRIDVIKTIYVAK